MRSLQVSLVAILAWPFLESVVASAPSQALGTASPLFEEVAKLFHEGDERVDLDQAKKLLTECAEASKRCPAGTGRHEEFYESADQFVKYLDNHRLEAADIGDLREWIAGSFECRDDGKKGVVDTLGNRISWALLRLSGSVSRGEGGYEPRHAIVCDVLSQPGISLPGLAARVLVNQRKAIGGPLPEDYEFGEIDAFLNAPANKALWNELLPACEKLDRSRTGNEHFTASDLIDEMLGSKDAMPAFERSLAEFVTLSDKLLKAYPNFAMAERLSDVCRLRVVWNVVHAHGDDRAKATYRKYIEDLREYFAKRADKVTVKWLDQVMENPGNPPEKFVVRLQLGEPEKKEQK